MALREDYGESLDMEMHKVIDLLRNNAKAYAKDLANGDPTTEDKVFHQTLNWFISKLLIKAIDKELQT
jgi:hypothetical protein